MRVLFDENLPVGLVEPLRLLGHTVDSVASLRLKGLDNGRLYREVASAYDLFFTKDREFANRVSTLAEHAALGRRGPRPPRLAHLPHRGGANASRLRLAHHFR